MQIEDILNERRAKLEALRKMGIDGFGEKFAFPESIASLKSNFQEGKQVSVAGRLMARRSHGKVTFADLQDKTDRIQLYIKADIVGKDAVDILDKVDLGDIIGVKGELFKTHTGEFTIKVSEVKFLSKSLRPMPEKWHGLKDVETIYRQRYLDLITNKQSRDVFLARTKIIAKIRQALDVKGFMEVETPMMHQIAGGAAGRPFKTHHNEYDIDLFLRIAPELYLKKLIVAGLEKVYEINRSFRNEGVSVKHNPEFTMLEVYSAYDDCAGMMKLCEELIIQAAQDVFGTLKFDYQGKQIDLTPPWRVVSFAQKIKEKFDINPDDDAKVMIDKLRKKGRVLEEERLSRMQIVKIVEDFLQDDDNPSPTFLVDYFTILCPLAKTKKDNPLLSERFELFISGMEVANAYSELNDPMEQRRRFEEELKENKTADAKLDEDFVEALEYGMPPAGGLGIGIDRLVMIFTNQASIRDVILFPLLRPSK